MARWWKCPNCGALDEADPNCPADVTPLHLCPALGGHPAPLLDVPAPDADPKARNVIVMRADYQGTASSPIAAVATEYADGRRGVVIFPEPAAVDARGGAI